MTSECSGLFFLLVDIMIDDDLSEKRDIFDTKEPLYVLII